MSGVRLYSIYLSNMVRDIDNYTVTKNLNSRSISEKDLLDVAIDLDDVVYLSDVLESSGEKGLVRSHSFLKHKLPTDSKGIILFDMGVDVVSKDVLKYCGTLLESGKTINTKDLGKLFIDISEGLSSTNDLSEKLLGDIYSNVSDDNEEIDEFDGVDYDLEDDIYSYDSVKEDLATELKYDGFGKGGAISDDFSTEDGVIYNDDLNAFNVRVGKNIEEPLIKDDFDLSSNSRETINDKLAYAISIAGSQIVKTPQKVKKGGKVIYSNMVDFDSE